MTKRQAINPLDCRPGYQLRRASLALTSEMTRRLERLELTLTETAIMITLASKPGQTQSAVGRILGIHRANMAPMVSRLQARGLIDRVDVDRRSHGLFLTAAGAELSAAADRVTGEVDAAFFRDDGNPDELTTRLGALWKTSD